MSILSGPEIARQVGAGVILIEPYDVRQLNPVSYDVRLGSSVLLVDGNFDDYDGEYLVARNGLLDPKVQQRTVPLTSKRDSGAHVLLPGNLYLGHTVERVRTNHYVPTIDGKSSIGRLGVFIHVTAGYGEPGFDGQWTLEIVVTKPTILYPGMRIGQMRFTTIEGERQQYAGNYSGEYSKGPIASRAWRQFEQDRREQSFSTRGCASMASIHPDLKPIVPPEELWRTQYDGADMLAHERRGNIGALIGVISAAIRAKREEGIGAEKLRLRVSPHAINCIAYHLACDRPMIRGTAPENFMGVELEIREGVSTEWWELVKKS